MRVRVFLCIGVRLLGLLPDLEAAVYCGRGRLETHISATLAGPQRGATNSKQPGVLWSFWSISFWAVLPVCSPGCLVWVAV